MYSGKDTNNDKQYQKNVGTEKKQPTSLYNRTLQCYTGFREIRDGSVWGQKAHRFLVAPELEMAMHYLMTPHLFSLLKENNDLTYLITSN